MERALNALYPEELKAYMEEIGQAGFRAKQLFHFFHVEKRLDLENAQVLPQTLRNQLRSEIIRGGKILETYRSVDGSRKYLIGFESGGVIETVYMPYSDRNTLCVSSQIGCRMGCRFCASTKAKFDRSLAAEEILSQVYLVEEDTETRIDNIVLMGIGEPLDNYDEVIRFIRLVTDPAGKKLSARSITLSSCGLIPGIYRLAEEGLQVNLAISLHATSDRKRRETMPIASKYSISEILKACRHYFDKTGRRVSFEYVLIKGVNDQMEDILWMADHLTGPESHVNLIPLNRIDEFRAEAAEQEALIAFQRQLEAKGVTVTIRNRRAGDIDGACGQLRIEHAEGAEPTL